jgi:hypothetical protein
MTFKFFKSILKIKYDIFVNAINLILLSKINLEKDINENRKKKNFLGLHNIKIN